MNVPTNRTQLPFVAEKKRDYRFLTDGRLLVFIDSPPSNFETLQSCLRWISLPYPGLSPNTKQQGLSIVFLVKESPIQFDYDKIQSIREYLQEGKKFLYQGDRSHNRDGFFWFHISQGFARNEIQLHQKIKGSSSRRWGKEEKTWSLFGRSKNQFLGLILSGIVFSDESYFKEQLWIHLCLATSRRKTRENRETIRQIWLCYGLWSNFERREIRTIFQAPERGN